MNYLLQHFFVRPTRQGVMFKFFSLIRNLTEQVSTTNYLLLEGRL